MERSLLPWNFLESDFFIKGNIRPTFMFMYAKFPIQFNFSTITRSDRAPAESVWLDKWRQCWERVPGYVCHTLCLRWRVSIIWYLSGLPWVFLGAQLKSTGHLEISKVTLTDMFLWMSCFVMCVTKQRVNGVLVDPRVCSWSNHIIILTSGYFCHNISNIDHDTGTLL